ncbi:MAG: FAD-dependent oxidoreductase [Clostridia bacterium]|nr:FAD-dependent oxidoreductase [Clostridia bacterium]
MPSFICALDEIMINEGVTLLFDTICSDVFMENGVCKGISVENKGGRCYYGCKQLIDTTGDLDLFKRAGAPCKDGLNWLSFWALSTNLDRLKKCCDSGDIQQLLKINMLGTDRDGIMNPPGVRRYTVDSGEEVTKFIMRGRAYLTEHLKNMDKTKEMVLQVPAQAQYRTTRYLDTDYTLSEKDKNKRHEDSVGCAWTFRDDGFFIEIPYRTMKAKGFRNMLTAGRTISSVGMACEVSRLIAPSAVSGEAAGTAAALSIEKDLDVNDLDITELQRELIGAGGIIHF